MSETAAQARARSSVVTGFEGTHLDAELAATFARSGFGGFILFARNAGTLAGVRALTDALRACYAHGPPPVVAVDQEGGRVARLREDVESMPSMMALGATGDASLAWRAGRQVAFDLRRAGCTLNFAPVLDLAVDPDNAAIGTRSLGCDPGNVARLGAAYAAGLESGGIVATPKHFPGHGSTSGDSHVELPAVNLSESLWRDRDLVPFAALAPGARAMMSAHVVLGSLDAANAATLSRRLLVGELRDELHFGGVCFTDCMQMHAIARTVGTPAGAAAAVAAGADGVLVSHSPELAQAAAARIARDAPPQRLAEAAARMRALRETSSAPLPLDAPPPEAGIGLEIARRAVTLLRGRASADAASCTVVSFEGSTDDGAADPAETIASLREAEPALAEERLPLDPAGDRVAALLERIAGRHPVVLMRHARRFASQRLAIRAILERFPDATIVAVRSPFDLECASGARHALATYGDESVSLHGLARVVFGGEPARGALPVELANGR
jgi:beta-N-acetylhexosaminidase